jgi:hypothetical protein
MPEKFRRYIEVYLRNSSRYVSMCIYLGFTLFTVTKVLRESIGIALLCFETSALEGGEGSASRPGRFLPPRNTLYSLYCRLGGPPGRPGQVRKISPPPGFDPRTVQLVASRYTDWTTRPTYIYLYHGFVAKRLTTFCGILFGKYRDKQWLCYRNFPFSLFSLFLQETCFRVYI